VTQPVFRFAPSPNGRLHLGHAYSALLNWDFAQRWGGRFLLRLEDIDTVRCRPELAAAVEEDLTWLGLTWEKPVRRQSLHLAEYGAVVAGLKSRGLVYPCFCSRRDIADTVARCAKVGDLHPRDPDGAPLYPGTCRSLPPETAQTRIRSAEPHAWRLDMARAVDSCPGPHAFVRFARDGSSETVDAAPARWGDAVLVRKDIPTSYHLSVVVDDALQEITHVVRGTDLEAATGLHVLLQALLGFASPRYHHHGLVLDRSGDKLSKTRRSQSLAELREQGVTADRVRRDLGFGPFPAPRT
jgi:glutamyl-Q tRNA(Asp) synthetase